MEFFRPIASTLKNFITGTCKEYTFSFLPVVSHYKKKNRTDELFCQPDTANKITDTSDTNFITLLMRSKMFSHEIVIQFLHFLLWIEVTYNLIW